MWPRITRFLKSQFPLDLASFLIILLCVGFLGITYYFNNVMANLASTRAPSNQGGGYILRDLGFDILPEWKQLWTVDFMDYLLMGLALVFVFFSPTPIYLFLQAILTQGLVNIARITTVATTSFPDPRIGCEQQTNNEIFTEVVLHRCGDNMFSGHTAIYAVVVLIYATYFNSAFRQQLSPLFRALVVFIVWGLGIGASLLIILNRSHYTIDVLVAWYVSTGVWFVQLWWWTRYAVRYKSLQIIIFPDNRRIEGINTWKAI